MSTRTQREQLGPAEGTYVRAPNSGGGTFVYHKVKNAILNDQTRAEGGGFHLTNCGRRIGGTATDAAIGHPVCPKC